MPRLRRSSPRRAGWTRHRWGRGFRYLDEHGDPVPPEGLERCRALRIPPAWTEVWICPWPNGHLQATGTDAAGRRQYLYHPDWRRARDRDKFQRALALGTRLPAARERVAQDLALPGMPRQRALAAGFRILDLGGLRIGTERYAREHGTVGVATIRRDHVRVRGDRVLLTFPGKSGRPHEVELRDPALAAAVAVLVRRRSGGPELLAHRRAGRWRDVRSAELNAYIQEVTGGPGSTAKDFRTWLGTVAAVAHLVGTPADETSPRRGRSATARRRAVAAAMRAVAEHLGNTPQVARTAYVDPRIVDRYVARSGWLPSLPEDLPHGEPGNADLRAWEPVVLTLLTGRPRGR